MTNPMIEIITLVVFILFILAIVWGHFLRKSKTVDVDKDIRDKTNKALYQEHKTEIEKDFQQAKIDQENYEYLLAELDKGLLQDMEENQLHSSLVKNNQQASIIWPIVISLFILIFSFTVYQQTGAFETLSQSKATQNKHAGLDQAQQEGVAYLEKLKTKIKAYPKDSNLWFEMGQQLVILGDFGNAMTAYDRALEIEGPKADLIGAKAQAAYYKYAQEITPEVQKLIDSALALDATDASTNILLGMHEFSGGKYQAAINYWQTVLDANKSVNVEALNQVINEAKSRLNMPTDKPHSNVETVSSAVGITVNVTMSTDIENKMIASEDKTVFVYAIPAEGARIPVAAMKLKASDLPTKLILDDSKAMNPQMKISNYENVHVFAVISNLGTPGIKTGDFKGQLDNLAVNTTDTVNIIIDTIVP